MKKYFKALEPIECMATVGDHSNPTFSISVNPDSKRIGTCYFKIFDSFDYEACELLARIDMKSPSYIYHRSSGKKHWSLNSKMKKNLMKFMQSESEVYNGTNWQACLFLWNRELHMFSKVKNESGLKLFEAYTSGYFDSKLSQYPSYMPSYSKMPDYTNLK